ncbi:MAG: HlyD family efflux transporter periplasmic adaptor subunit [Bdellovibrio sp.]|nr:HlyD family efflux transporter periplasmic adaptor subunit [Bdellovibrio sp.]
MGSKILMVFLALLVLIPICRAQATAQLERTVLIYGIVKPKKMSTVVAIGQGLVNQIFNQIGDEVKKGSGLLQVFERDTVRNYSNTLDGRVAKVHVTLGAAISPGMPLVTVVNDGELYLEFGLSPSQAQLLKQGTTLRLPSHKEPLGILEKISPIVDPESGSVVALSSVLQTKDFLIGQVLTVSVSLGVADCDQVVALKEVNQFTTGWKVDFISDDRACLKKVL